MGGLGGREKGGRGKKKKTKRGLPPFSPVHVRGL